MINYKEIQITPCYYLNITFYDPEGLNKFTEFLLKNNIKGFGVELSKRNVNYQGFFHKDEIDKIQANFNI